MPQTRNKSKYRDTIGCVLFIIPRSDDKIDPLCEKLYESHAITSVIHRSPSVIDNNEMIENQIAKYGKILCAVYPDDVLICDEWAFEEISLRESNLDKLLKLIEDRGIPILPLSMEWSGAFDDCILFTNPDEAYRDIMATINE